MKKLLFIPSLLALMFCVFSCDQFSPCRKYGCKNQSINGDLNYFKKNFIDRHTGMKPFGESWEAVEESNNFDSGIVTEANRETSDGLSTAKLIIGIFESGDLKTAYITRNAYYIKELKGDSAGINSLNVYIKLKADRDNFENMLKGYYNFFNRKDCDNNYLVNVKVGPKAFVNLDEKANKYPHDAILLGTVVSISEEESFREFVKEKGLNINEIGGSSYSKRYY